MRSRIQQGVGQEGDTAGSLQALVRAVPMATVQAVAARAQRPGQRVRKLPLTRLLLLVLAMSVYTHEALELVFLRLVEGLLARPRTRLSVAPLALARLTRQDWHQKDCT